ncbi:MAG: DUF4178 domain-containing protein [Caulobacteraceae bacterium]
MSDPAAPTAMKALTCPACGAPVNLRAAGYTVTVACGHCGATLDALDPELKLIASAQQALSVPRIALGTRGTLAGVVWETVGYLERTDGDDPWSEYLLFNPYYGYRFLVDGGHRWTLGRLLDASPKTKGDSARIVDGLLFRQDDDAYEVSVTVALGEFYWRVAVGDTVRATDFTGPGIMLSREEADDEETWTRLDVLANGVVEGAFALTPGRGQGSAGAPNQFAGAGAPRQFGQAAPPASDASPTPKVRQSKPHCTLARIALVVWLVVCFIHPSSAMLKSVQIDTPLDQPNRTVTLEAIDLPRPHNRVVVQTQGRMLDNAWIDVDVDLVNEKTQATFEGSTIAEHYSGVDSDGSWSEGKTDNQVVFSKVPAGRYNVVLDVGAHRWSANAPATASWSQGASAYSSDSAPSPQLLVWVNRGGLSMGNAILAFLAIVIPSAVISYTSFRARLRRDGVIK